MASSRKKGRVKDIVFDENSKSEGTIKLTNKL
jgi:hypothetical protein